MPAVTATGLGSGIDIQSLVQDLVAAEGNTRFEILDLDEADALEKISAFGSLKGSLSDFRLALADLKILDAFQKRQAKSADNSIFTATSTNKAQAGNFDIEVVQLAQAHKVRSKDFLGSTSIIGTGELLINLGSKQATVEVELGNHHLSGIRDAINEQAGSIGITATIVSVDTGSRLVLSSETTGVSNQISITVNDDDGIDVNDAGLSQLASNYLVQSNEAKDSIIKIDNSTVTESSNTVTDAIDGVTLTLLKTSAPAETTNLSISHDTLETVNKVQAFVDAYNVLNKNLNSLTEFKGEGLVNGVLLGDATVRSVEYSIRNVINDVVNISSDFNLLVEIGITTKNTSGSDLNALELDTTKLTNVLNDDFDAVGELFSSKDGVAAKLDNVIESFVQSNGLLDTRIDSLEGRVENYQEQRQDIQSYLDKLEARLFSQYNAMDVRVAELKATSDFLAQAIESFVKPQSTGRNK